MFRQFAFSIVLSALSALPVWAQETLEAPQQLPGTSVTLQVLDGMEVSDRFSGFHDHDTKSSIMILDSDIGEHVHLSPYFEPTQTAEDMWSTQGLHDIEITTINISGQTIPLIKGVQYVGADQIVTKRIVLLKGERSVMVSYTILGDVSDTLLEQSIQSIRLGNAPTPDNILESLPFGFEPQDPFVHMEILGNNVTLDSFEGPMVTGMESRVIISPSLYNMDMSDPKSASETLIRDMTGFGYGTYRYFGEMTIQGRKAYKAEVETATMLSTHYLIPTGDKTFVRLQSRGKTKNIRPLEPVIDAIAKSIIIRE